MVIASEKTISSTKLMLGFSGIYLRIVGMSATKPTIKEPTLTILKYRLPYWKKIAKFRQLKKDIGRNIVSIATRGFL